MHVCNFCGGAHARLICPIKKAANKNARKYLSTPVNVSRLSAELLHHPDPHFFDYVISGLSNGFHPGVSNLPTQNLICPNLQSALTEPETVDILIKKEIDAKFMIGPFSVPPFNVFRVSPIGIATRKFSGKKRLIIDLSSPHNSPFPSINSLIPLEEFSLHYHDIDQAITLIKTVAWRGGSWHLACQNRHRFRRFLSRPLVRIYMAPPAARSTSATKILCIVRAISFNRRSPFVGQRVVHYQYHYPLRQRGYSALH